MLTAHVSLCVQVRFAHGDGNKKRPKAGLPFKAFNRLGSARIFREIDASDNQDWARQINEVLEGLNGKSESSGLQSPALSKSPTTHATSLQSPALSKSPTTPATSLQSPALSKSPTTHATSLQSPALSKSPTTPATSLQSPANSNTHLTSEKRKVQDAQPEAIYRGSSQKNKHDEHGTLQEIQEGCEGCHVGT